MRKMIGLLLTMVMFLAACGGLKNDINGNEYNLKIGEGTKASNMMVKFDGDIVYIDGDKEKMKYEVSGDEIILKEDEKNGTQFTLYQLTENNGSYTGKAKMMEEGVELPIAVSFKMTKQ